eukprot:1154823-Pelagomonas_calceolata.AAC.1
MFRFILKGSVGMVQKALLTFLWTVRAHHHTDYFSQGSYNASRELARGIGQTMYWLSTAALRSAVYSTFCDLYCSHTSMHAFFGLHAHVVAFICMHKCARGMHSNPCPPPPGPAQLLMCMPPTQT